MDPKDAIAKALTPGTLFNQQGKAWRSLSTLAQFSSLSPGEVLEILEQHFAGLVAVRPSQKRPQHGPLVAFIEHAEQLEANAPIKIAGGPAFAKKLEEPDEMPVLKSLPKDALLLKQLEALTVGEEDEDEVPEL